MFKSIGKPLLQKVGYFKILVLILGAVFIILVLRNGQRKIEEKTKKALIQKQCSQVPAEETIFVSIPSAYGHMDETINTISNLFDRAYCPHRIYVGVYQTSNKPEKNQGGFKSKQFLERYRKLCKLPQGNFESNIKILNEEKTDARGSANARHMIEKYLYKGEKYYLCIRTNCQLCYNWDEVLIADIAKCSLKSNKPMITQLPEDSKKVKQYNDPPTFTCFDHWTAYGIPSCKSISFKNPPVRPFLSLFWTPDFSFTFACVIDEVPFDPWYQYMTSDEYGWPMTIRLWTNGYDFFSPSQCIIYSNNNNKKAHSSRVHFNAGDSNQTLDKETSYYRLWILLEMVKDFNLDFNVYDLGKQRPVTDFQNLVGLDWHTKKAEQQPFVGMHLKNIAHRKQNNNLDRFPFENEEVVAKYGSWTEFYAQTNFDTLENKIKD